MEVIEIQVRDSVVLLNRDETVQLIDRLINKLYKFEPVSFGDLKFTFKDPLFQAFVPVKYNQSSVSVVYGTLVSNYECAIIHEGEVINVQGGLDEEGVEDYIKRAKETISTEES